LRKYGNAGRRWLETIRSEMQDVGTLERYCLPDLTGVAAKVVAGDQPQLGRLLMERPAADAVAPARSNTRSTFRRAISDKQVDAAIGTLRSQGALGEWRPGVLPAE